MIKVNDETQKLVVQQYEQGITLNDIAFNLGLNRILIKRILAEQGYMYLHWYKTNEENKMLEYLLERGIDTLNKLELYV